LERKWENGIDLKKKIVEDLTSLNCVRFEVPGAVGTRLIVMLTLVAAGVNETLLGQTSITLPGCAGGVIGRVWLVARHCFMWGYYSTAVVLLHRD
jgi:hypothetical protein